MDTKAPITLAKSLSPVHVGALALGCIVGWIGFVAPGAEYLPEAGPAGTLLAIAVAALAMMVFAANYGYMVQRLPVAGGEFAFARSAFGGTHAFVCVWFLGLAYLCPVALNATAIGFVARTLFHDTLMVGPHWTIAGYKVYLPPLALSVGAIAFVAALCARGVRDTGVFQTVLVLALGGGAAVVAGALALQPSVWAAADPALHPAAEGGRSLLPGFFMVLSVAPCLFVGFDTVPQSAEEFAFGPRLARRIMVGAILAGAALYAALALVAASAPPPDAADPERGIQAFPVFHAAWRLLGGTGVAFLSYAALAAALTGLVGFFTAASRLLWAMARAGVVSPWLGRLSAEHRTPVNAILFVSAVSMAAPLFGRNALGWLSDLCSLGAAVAYGYTSAAAFRFARREGRRAVQATGAAGVALSAVFALLLVVPLPGLNCAMKPHSWAILAVWVALGGLLRLTRRGGGASAAAEPGFDEGGRVS